VPIPQAGDQRQSKQLANINSIEESKDVVLHEIAHALNRGWVTDTMPTGRGCASRWVQDPRDATPLRVQGGNVKQLKGKYKLINKETGKVYKEYYRKPKFKDWSQRWIVGKKRETQGKLQVVRA
jgi:hypothetical protein